MSKRLEVLNGLLERSAHNLFCYSRNYAMTQPKNGYESEWNKAREECDVLDELILMERNDNKAAAIMVAVKEVKL